MNQHNAVSTLGLLLVVIFALGLLVGCTSQDAAPTGPTPLPSAAEAVETETHTATPITESQPDVAEVAETDVQPDDAAPDAEAESTSPVQWEEGPITFKSDSLHGNMTASGEPFDKDSFTAAHKELPFDTEVTVINLFNGQRTTVRINDRLPPQVSAVIDISPAAAREIEMIDAGIVEGRIEWQD